MRDLLIDVTCVSNVPHDSLWNDFIIELWNDNALRYAQNFAITSFI